MMFSFIGTSPWELAIVAGVVLLLFGKRLPSAMHSVGRSIVEFKKGVKGIDEDEEGESQETSKKAPESAAPPA